MARLPKLPYRMSRSRATQVVFGGLNHTATARDGEIFDGHDFSTEEYPALVPRSPRLCSESSFSDVSYLGFNGSHLYWMSSSSFFFNGEEVMHLSDEIPADSRRAVCLGEKIVVWPDKVAYDTVLRKGEELSRYVVANALIGREHAVNRQILTTTTAEADFSEFFNTGDTICLRFSASSLQDLNGTYTALAVKSKTITLAEGSLSRVGIKGIVEIYKDGASEQSVQVYIECSSEYPNNRDTLTLSTTEQISKLFSVGDAILLNGNRSRSYIIDEISGTTLYFTAGEITGFSAYGSTVAGCIVERMVPDLDYICACDNRVFGCRGAEIYASKLGDPANWNYIHAPSLSVDSWYLDTGDPSPFTACCVYEGRPHFFTERSVTVLYGDSPAQFSTVTTQIYGVRSGSADSLVSVDGALFYLSPHGFVRYSSEGVDVLSDRLGVSIRSAIAGTCGRCYFTSVTLTNGTVTNYRLSLKSGLWAKEDNRVFSSFATVPGKLLAITPGVNGANRIMIVAGEYDREQETVDSQAFHTADFPNMSITLAPLREDRTEISGLRSRWVQKLYLRLIRTGNEEISISILFDNGIEREVMRRNAAVAADDGDLPVARLGTEEIVQIPVPNNRCDSYRLLIRVKTATAYADVKLLGMSREYYTFK